MIPVTQASQFFDSLPPDNEGAYEKLSSLIEKSSPEREEEWLDYKNGRNIPLDTTEGKDKIRELWGKALSGFANSGGGLVIWGIQTETIASHDVPKNLALVPNPAQLEGLLKNYLGTEVEPPVLNVRTRSIPDNGKPGFVVADIPPSKLKPHRAKMQGQYYLRASHQHVEAGPSLLRIMFYPNSTPILNLFCDPSKDAGNHAFGFHVHFRIINSGYGTAADLVLFIQAMTSPLAFEFNEKSFITDGGNSTILPLRARFSLHPSLGVRIGSADMKAGCFWTVKAFGKDFEPCQWSIAMDANGIALIKGPFDVMAVLTPES